MENATRRSPLFPGPDGTIRLAPNEISSGERRSSWFGSVAGVDVGETTSWAWTWTTLSIVKGRRRLCDHDNVVIQSAAGHASLL